MLVAAQAVAIALGALPVFWLARKHLGSEHAALGFALAYLLYPAVQWLTLNEFHPVALACPLLLYAFWYLDEDRLAAFAIFAVLAALTKEEIPLVIAGMGLWYAVSRRRWRGWRRDRGRWRVLTAISVEIVMPHFNEGASSSFYQRYGALGQLSRRNPATLFTDPGRVLSRRPSTARASTTCSTSSCRSCSSSSPRRSCCRRGSGARPQPALGDPHAELDPPPLHRRADPAAVRRHVLGAARLTRSRPSLRVPLAMTLVVAMVGRELRARCGAGLARSSRRADVPGVRVARRDATTGSRIGRCG